MYNQRLVVWFNYNLRSGSGERWVQKHQVPVTSEVTESLRAWRRGMQDRNAEFWCWRKGCCEPKTEEVAGGWWLVNVKGEADGWILEHNMRSVARAVRDPFVIVGEVMAELTWLWLPTCRVQRSQALSAGNPSGCHWGIVTNTGYYMKRDRRIMMSKYTLVLFEFV